MMFHGVIMTNNKAAAKQAKVESQALSRNLARLIKDRRTSEATISEALGLPVLTVRRISSGETADPHISTLKQLADYFQVSVDALIDGNLPSSVHIMNTVHKPQFTPILDWQTATEMTNIQAINLAEWKEWHAIIPMHPISNFAFTVKSKPSMHPRFPIGTLFTIDPAQPALDGDLVVIRMLQDGTLSLREICIDPPRWQLKPTIPGSDTLFFDASQHQVVGPVVLTITHGRSGN